MLKFFILSTLLALAAANTIDPFVGEWRAIKVFAKDPVVQECDPMTVTDLKQYCTCGSDDKVSKVKLTIGPKFIVWPAFYFTTWPEVQESLKTECTCDGNKAGHYIIYRINDNYILLMFTDPGLKFSVLMSKNVPSEAEVTEFINSDKYLKDNTSHFVCTSEILNSDESKHTTGKRWWQHEKSQ